MMMVEKFDGLDARVSDVARVTLKHECQWTTAEWVHSLSEHGRARGREEEREKERKKEKKEGSREGKKEGRRRGLHAVGGWSNGSCVGVRRTAIELVEMKTEMQTHRGRNRTTDIGCRSGYTQPNEPNGKWTNQRRQDRERERDSSGRPDSTDRDWRRAAADSHTDCRQLLEPQFDLLICSSSYSLSSISFDTLDTFGQLESVEFNVNIQSVYYWADNFVDFASIVITRHVLKKIKRKEKTKVRSRKRVIIKISEKKKKK